MAPDPDSVPWAGPDGDRERQGVAVGIDAGERRPATATPCLVDTDRGVAVGAWFGGTTSLTVIDTVAGADVNSPSLTVNVNSSVPK